MINGIKEYIDIIEEEQFRSETMAYLRESNGVESYSVPSPFPPLYKYRALSTYAVEDIMNHRFAATSIGSFNDVFDGAMHAYGDEKQRTALAQKKWEEIEELGRRCGLPGLLPHDSFVKNMEAHYKQESRSKFRMDDYLGTYVFCLSERNDSILMWAHYANENTGICIEYDFNELDGASLVRKCLFPVLYCSKPIDVLPLFDKDNPSKLTYPIDTAALCTALSKADVWEYEKEWRFVEIDIQAKAQRLFRQATIPKRIIFGNRLLKPLFYYQSDDNSKRKKCEEAYDLIMRLLDYMVSEGIRASIAIPKVGFFELEMNNLDASKLKQFLTVEFGWRNKSENMRYYDVIEDKLYNFIDKEKETELSKAGDKNEHDV